MRLDGIITLITGVSQYMGPAFTRTFTDAGAIVVTQDHTHADATPHAEYAARNSRGGSIIEADLTQPDDVDAMFAAIDEQFGRLDIGQRLRHRRVDPVQLDSEVRRVRRPIETPSPPV
jgi:NAD(P)-dependent dehydrogenase (short-subunit alcohol dehydrogenase family)